MPYFLGIDTSNYTTSASVYDSDSGKMIMKKKLLPVRKGECGLRQSDAVFHHVRQLPEIMEELFSGFNGSLAAVGVSSRPRDIEGSYMPCFTVGHSVARSISLVEKIPLYTFSHQNGHIAAALYSSQKTDLIGKSFLAFHVSGGTTEAVEVEPDPENVFRIRIAAKTLDLNAGQLIDRVGVMLGLDFPCGMQLERLALKNKEKISPRPTLKGSDCCLSGVQNICEKALKENKKPEYIAALCLGYVEAAIEQMCARLLETRGQMPVVFAGGVMSDKIIREKLQNRFVSYFASPEYSSDNASGTALLCSVRYDADKKSEIPLN